MPAIGESDQTFTGFVGGKVDKTKFNIDNVASCPIHPQGCGDASSSTRALCGRRSAYALRTAAALLKGCVRRDALDAACELLANLGQLGARAGGDALGELYRQAADYVASRRHADALWSPQAYGAGTRAREEAGWTREEA